MQLTPQARANKVTKFEIKFNVKDWKLQTAEIVVLMADSKIFRILLKLIFAMIPKHDLIHICCYPTKQFYKNNGGQEEIVSKVEKQLNVTRFSRLRKISGTA
jgi:hypothetical protein